MKRVTGYEVSRDYIINQKIKKIIDDESKKPTAIADKAGIRRDTFSRIIRCQRPLYADEIVPICDAIGITIEDLFKEEEDHAKNST